MLLSFETCAVAVGVTARSGAISSTNTAKRREWVFVIVVDLNEFIVDVLSLDWFDPATAGLKEGKKTPRERSLTVPRIQIRFDDSKVRVVGL